MATPVTMPMLGLTMEEGTVAEWLKAEGESVNKDEPLLTVEMDKGTVEVPAPASGVLLRIVVQPGTTVPVKTLIAEIGASNEATSGAAPATGSSPAAPVGPAAPAAPAPAAAASAVPAAAASVTAEPATAAPLAGGPGDLPAATPPVVATAAASGGSATAQPSMAVRGERQFVSPRARMRARELGVAVESLSGSGPKGRVVEADVLATAQGASKVLVTPMARRLAEEHGVSLADLQGTGPGGRITQDDVVRAATLVEAGAAPSAAVEEQPLSRVRRVVAERMAASAQATARVTLFLEADFSEVARFRAQLQPEFARLGVEKLPWDAILARAAALALLEHQAVQARWTAAGLSHPDGVHVGVAVALEPEGLVVPVLRDAHSRSLRELAADLLGLVERARAGRLTPGEMQGGTFTITNLGGYRVDGFTPIINPPETAILGVGRIADKAVVVEGKIEARPMCTLSLSFDHRVVDGAPAAAFLVRLAELLERPYALLGI
jgi:pyruvate dehydrogenase E2 component (dihydrolipoamide acetyltransferase)